MATNKLFPEYGIKQMQHESPNGKNLSLQLSYPPNSSWHDTAVLFSFNLVMVNLAGLYCSAENQLVFVHIFSYV